MAGTIKKTGKGVADGAVQAEVTSLAEGARRDDIERQAREEGHAGVIHLPFQALEVTSIGPVFHRCGRAFTQVATVIPIDDLTADERQRLQDEPRLKVREVTVGVDDIDLTELS